ncbi:MAG: YhfT family protein [Brevinema sp.]
MEYIVIASIGGLSAYLANQNIAVFNDGLRPIMPEYKEGRMDRKSLFTTSFALSFGLVIGFGIPFSLTTSIILIHSILLGTDIIGTLFDDKKKLSIILSILCGAIYAISILVGLQFVVDLFAKLPINFLPSLSQLGTPIIVTFSLFPALVVAYQYGFKKGLLTFIGTVLVRQFCVYYGAINFNSSLITINADGMALFTGVTLMLLFAIQEKSDEQGANAALLGIFAERIINIKKNMWILALSGGLITTAISLHMLAGDPISLNLLADGKPIEAGITSFVRAIGFVPLIGTTTIATGLYTPAGMKFIDPVGFFAPNPLIAFVLGFITIILEILGLEKIALFLDKFPGIKKCGDQIRSSMSQVLEFSLTAGAILAAHDMAPNFGFLIVAGFVTLNKYSKNPIVPIAVGPIAVIFTGLLINILNLVGLYQV